MKKFILLFLFLLGLLNTGCSYHGTLRRGIYPSSANNSKINARVLVVTDQFIPTRITILHPYKKGDYAFLFNTADGVAVAAADALGSLFGYVDAGPAHLAPAYDYVAYVNYEVVQVLKSSTSGVVISEENLPLEELADLTGLHTYVHMTLQRPEEGTPRVSLYAAKHRPVTYGENTSSFLRWPRLITPFSVQRRGRIIRHWLETDLTESLQQMMYQLQQKRQELSPSNAD